MNIIMEQLDESIFIVCSVLKKLITVSIVGIKAVVQGVGTFIA